MAWEAVAVAATEGTRMRASLVAAALAMPGLLVPASQARAEAAPDQTTVGVKYLGYRDWQPYDPAQPARSGDRIHVRSPQVWWTAPVGSTLSISGSAVYDSVSGASPYYHNTLSGASRKGYIDEQRKAAEVAVSWYGEHDVVTLGLSNSGEHDYHSNALSADWRINTDGNNRTWELGVSASRDRIDAVTAGVTGKHKDSWSVLAGVTQVLTPNDLVQINLTYADGSGYFSDPYKNEYGIDIRPDRREQLAILAKYNHYVERFDASLRTSVRHYRDSFGVRSATLSVEWAQPVRWGIIVTPDLRYTTQSAASFYFDPPFPAGAGTQAYYSADTRLSAFGAITYGLKLEKAIGSHSKVDLKFEQYEQRASWRLGGHGSMGLLPFYARFWQIGWSTSF